MSPPRAESAVASGETRTRTSGRPAALERGKPIRPLIETLKCLPHAYGRVVKAQEGRPREEREPSRAGRRPWRG